MANHELYVVQGKTLDNIAGTMRAVLGVDKDTPIRFDEVASNDKTEQINTDIETQADIIEQIKTALNGKAAGGGVTKEEQEKTIDITENGTTEVTPDEGKALSKVTVNVAIESGGEDTLTARFANTLTEYATMNAISLPAHAFNSCSSLIKFSAPNLVSTARNATFYMCTGLKFIDMGKITGFSPSEISGLHKMTSVIFRNTETVVSLTAVFSNNHSITREDYTLGNILYYCYFYVPKALIEEYKVATNWSNYAHRFRAIEDYPEITGGVI